MEENMTVVEALDRVRAFRRSKQCLRCAAPVSIRGMRGEYWWTCSGCDAVGFGYATRAAARRAIRNGRS